MAEKLAAQVGALIWWDDGSHPGDHKAGCANTHIGALASVCGSRYADDAGWVCILEDDAVPVIGFREHLDAALSAASAGVVGLYLGTGNPVGETQQKIRTAVNTARTENKAWLAANCLIGSVGYAVRAELMDGMIEYIDGRDEELPMRISRWAQAHDVAICYTMPSLVDHDDVESIGRPWRGPHYHGRKAWWFGARESWDTGSVALGHCLVWSGPEE
jgi:hypothetical protein